jgi:hypothetical protein
MAMCPARKRYARAVGASCIVGWLLAACGQSHHAAPGTTAKLRTDTAVAVSGPLTQQPIHAGARCPVTKPVSPPASIVRAFRSVPGGSIPTGLTGHGTLFVVIPVEPSVQRDPATGMLVEPKLVWFVTARAAGPLHIVGRRLDGRGRLVADTSGGSIPIGATGYIQPTSVEIVPLGCWDIAGTDGDTVTEFVWSPVLRAAR